MEKYNYRKEMFEDVKNAMLEHYSDDEIISRIKDDEDEFAEQLNEDLWCDDSVTGNGSGSYYCN